MTESLAVPGSPFFLSLLCRGLLEPGGAGWLAAGPFALLFSATVCLQLLGGLLLVRPRRVAVFALAALAPLVTASLAGRRASYLVSLR